MIQQVFEEENIIFEVIIDEKLEDCALSENAKWFNVGSNEALNYLSYAVTDIEEDEALFFTVDRIRLIISDLSGTALYDFNKSNNVTRDENGQRTYDLLINTRSGVEGGDGICLRCRPLGFGVTIYSPK